METIFDIPELLIHVLSFVKQVPQSFVRCLSVNKSWREIVIENTQELLDAYEYAQCQGATVRVGCVGEKDFEFRVPGYQAQLLVIAGAIKVDRTVDRKLCFSSRDIAEQWFRTARRYVDVEPQNRPQPLTVVDWAGSERTTSFAGGRLMAPIVRPKTGQLWFWAWDTHKNRSLDQAKEELLKAFRSTEPHVVVGAGGLGLVGFDGRDRIWFKLGQSELLHGLGENEYVTITSKTRAEAGLPDNKPKGYKEYFHTGEINSQAQPICTLDHQKRFYVSDSIGVHIIHPDSPEHFEYHSTYKINYEKNIFYESNETFYTLYKHVDSTGKLFVWSTPGMFGWSGTVGYWTYDGNKWENVDIVQGIYYIAVRIVANVRQIWLFLARDVKILEEPLSGGTRPVLVPLKELASVDNTYESRIIARSADGHEAVVLIGNKSFLLDSKTNQREPQTLPDNVHKLFSATDLGKVTWGNNMIKDGTIYFADDKKIVAVSVDGKTITNYSCTETLSDPRVHYVVTKERKYTKPVTMIYLRGGNMTYLLDTSVKFVDFSGVPGLHINSANESNPDPEGHIYHTIDNKWYRWQADHLPRLLPANFASSPRADLIVYGNEGLIISKDPPQMYQNGESIAEKDFESLVDKHYDKLVKCLPYPPRRSFGHYANVVHDGLGNIWIRETTQLSVRTPEGFIRLDTTIHRPDVNSKGHVTIYAMAPLGNGSAIVLIEKYKGLIVKINKETMSFDVDFTPIGVQYTMYSSEWRENTFYDKRGVYVISEEWSMENLANGMHYKTYQLADNTTVVLKGKLLLIDRHSGKWFYQERINAAHPSTLIYRPDQTSSEFKLEISLSRQMIGEDFLVNQSAWLHTDNGLTRVRFNGTALEVTERLKMVVANRMRAAVSNGRHVLWGSDFKTCNCLVLDEKSFK